MPSLVEIGPLVLEKKMKMWKVYDDNDDNDGQRTNFDQKSSVEPRLRWAKNKFIIFIILKYTYYSCVQYALHKHILYIEPNVFLFSRIPYLFFFFLKSIFDY